MTIRIVLADDHAGARQSLARILKAQPDFAVVAETGGGVETLNEVTGLEPDVLLIDLMMPEMTGLDIARVLFSRGLPTNVIIVSVQATQSYVLEALRQGVKGYVLKDSSARVIVEAVRTVARGDIFLGPPLSISDVRSFAESTQGSELDLFETLDELERKILEMLACDVPPNVIASELVIDPQTFTEHISRLRAKLGIKNHTGLLRYAREHYPGQS